MKHIPFDEIYAIMDVSFPDTELRTYEEQQALLNNPHYRIICETDELNKISGILAVWEFDEFRYVEHIAVNPAIRGGGIGRKMMEMYIAQSTKPVLLEVEPASDELTQRRIGFYERLGFHLNTFPYVQPPLRKGNADLELNIMSYPRLLMEAEFKPFRETLYKEVFNITVTASKDRL